MLSTSSRHFSNHRYKGNDSMSNAILSSDWKQHPTYKDYYFSRFGIAASIKKGRFLVLKGTVCGQIGYQAICVSGKTKVYVHRVVCELFNGPVLPGQQCRHLDGNPKNNDAKNLKWGTASENSQDKIAHGTNGEGEQNPMSKLSKSKVEQIRNMVANGNSQISMCSIFNVSAMTISRIVRKESWK
jgi:hypothetical protein